MTDPRKIAKERIKKAGWVLETTGMAKSGYAPRKAELAEWVIEQTRELLSALDALDAARKERDTVSANWEALDKLWQETVAERDELQAALDAADGRTETIRIYEDFLRELGIDTSQPQEKIFVELRRRWDELVVAADPSVMENR